MRVIGEYTYSKYTKYIKHNNKQLYYDKMRLESHPQEIIYVTTDYVNEGLKHVRNDAVKTAKEQMYLRLKSGNR